MEKDIKNRLIFSRWYPAEFNSRNSVTLQARFFRTNRNGTKLQSGTDWTEPVRSGTDRYNGYILQPRIISLHDFFSLARKKIRKKKNEKRDEKWGAEMEGWEENRARGLEIEREPKGTKCNLDKAVSLLTSSFPPSICIYIYALYYIVYII